MQKVSWLTLTLVIMCVLGLTGPSNLKLNSYIVTFKGKSY